MWWDLLWYHFQTDVLQPVKMPQLKWINTSSTVFYCKTQGSLALAQSSVWPCALLCSLLCWLAGSQCVFSQQHCLCCAQNQSSHKAAHCSLPTQSLRHRRPETRPRDRRWLLPCPSGSQPSPLPSTSWSSLPGKELPFSCLTPMSCGSYWAGTRMTRTAPITQRVVGPDGPSSGQTAGRFYNCTTNWEDKSTPPHPTWSTWWDMQSWNVHYRSKVWGHLEMSLFFKEKHFFLSI